MNMFYHATLTQTIHAFIADHFPMNAAVFETFKGLFFILYSYKKGQNQMC